MNINEEYFNISYKAGSKVKITIAATALASGINTAQPTNTAAKYKFCCHAVVTIQAIHMESATRIHF